jgi:hypothetical protein
MKLTKGIEQRSNGDAWNVPLNAGEALGEKVQAVQRRLIKRRLPVFHQHRS